MNPILEKGRVRTGTFASSERDGFNGFFELIVNGEPVRIIASDGMGWQHVSVSKPSNRNKPPNWQQMCEIKELFWGDDVWVVQFHPARKDYVNNHPGCLHLWRPTSVTFPTPPDELVGMKKETPESMAAMPHSKQLAIYAEANLKHV